MTKTQLIRHALRLWQVPHVPKETNRANARKWVAAVQRLGDKWVYAEKMSLKRIDK